MKNREINNEKQAEAMVGENNRRIEQQTKGKYGHSGDQAFFELHRKDSIEMKTEE